MSVQIPLGRRRKYETETSLFSYRSHEDRPTDAKRDRPHRRTSVENRWRTWDLRRYPFAIDHEKTETVCKTDRSAHFSFQTDRWYSDRQSPFARFECSNLQWSSESYRYPISSTESLSPSELFPVFGKAQLNDQWRSLSSFHHRFVTDFELRCVNNRVASLE